ncbi:MAG: hypothetical protein QF415_13425 [Candidatus Undinarchaeales archaeon]|jgi:multisubunit Na+/H+ antiporter MnhF subunit|nr:hypothetical protein [Candidatus Undinarchaeales archaeon]MDP7494478.1 hypothetical protein [Candidatus Undinarchaeales archaeon]
MRTEDTAERFVASSDWKDRLLGIKVMGVAAVLSFPTIIVMEGYLKTYVYLNTVAVLLLVPALLLWVFGMIMFLGGGQRVELDHVERKLWLSGHYVRNEKAPIPFDKVKKIIHSITIYDDGDENGPPFARDEDRYYELHVNRKHENDLVIGTGDKEVVELVLGKLKTATKASVERRVKSDR